MFYLGLQAAAWRVPFLPTRAGLGLRRPPRQPRPAPRPLALRRGQSLLADPPTPTSSSWPCRRSTSTRPSSTSTGPTPPATASSSARPVLRRALPRRRRPPLRDGRARRRERRRWSTRAHPLSTVPSTACSPTASPRPAGGAHFTACPPDYGRDEAFQKDYAAAAADPAAWEAFAARYVLVDEAEYQARVEERRGPGEPRRPASPGPRSASWPAPTPGAAPARSWPAPSAPSPPSGPGWPGSPSPPTSSSPTARRRYGRHAAARDADRAELVREARHALPQRLRRGVVGPAPHHDDGDPDRPLRQPEHLGHRRRPARRRSSSACAARRATRSTTPPATGCPTTRRAASSSRSTWSAASATPGRRGRARRRRASTTSAVSSPTSACSTSRRRTAPCGCARSTPVSASTTSWPPPASSSSSPTTSAETRLPTPEELDLIRDVLDPRLAPRSRGADLTAGARLDRRRRGRRTTRRCAPSCANWSACATRSCRRAWAGWPAPAWWRPPARPAASASWPRPP